MNEIKVEDICGVDLNYPHGERIPALIQIEGQVYMLYGMDANDVELQPNYILAGLHDHCGREVARGWKTALIGGAVPLPFDKVYALQCNGQHDKDAKASFKGLRFCNGGSARDGTRWNIA